MINSKETAKGILTIGLYYITPLLLSIPFSLLLKKFYSDILYQILNLSLYLILTIIFCILYRKALKKDIEDFKKNGKKYIKPIINYWLKGLFLMIATSFILTIFEIGANVNQEGNVELLKEMPVVEIICACILAPIMEEIVFRLSFRNATNNKTLFAVVTGLIFGFVHVVSSLKNPLTILYIIPYGAVGICLGLLYKDTNNICSSITAHAIHNTLTIIELLLLGATL